MAINFILPLRIAQVLLAIIALGLTAFVAHWYNSDRSIASPSQINFYIFVTVWTAILAVPYLTLAPRFFPITAHKFGILAAEVITMIFWFGAWVATAAFLGHLAFCGGNPCNAARAAVVFGAIEWLLFMATTIMASIHVFRTRNNGNEKPPLQMQHNGL